ncbi:MAG TPA: hypothetical protein VGT03_12380, partial [Candidatus Acidoferrales bacterium]|nr:hypothetical protein [Candidatus Acidoferrales bacterium]
MFSTFGSELGDEFLKDAAAVLKNVELVEAGAGRRKENRVTWFRFLECNRDGALKRYNMFEWHGAIKLSSNLAG